MRCVRVIVVGTLLVIAASSAPAAEPSSVTPLPGTEPLTISEPLDEVMVSGIDRFALREIEASPERRAEKWNRDYSSPEAYAKSVAPNRERFRTIIGLDPFRFFHPGDGLVGTKPASERKSWQEQILDPDIEFIATTARDAVVAKAETYTVFRVRWAVLDGVTAEGLWFMPNVEPVAAAVALPDADWTPEQFAGLAAGVEPSAQLPRRLAAAGMSVLVPTLISRDDAFSGNPEVAMTNQPHREFIYRMAFEMGRHVIGYEVQKVRAAVEALKQLSPNASVGVAGVGEGGLLALYSAAVDQRIDAALVCGYFQKREGLWEEPIYRNVWSLLTEFGDAEIASLIAPRPLVIEACAVPEVAGPPQPQPGRRGGAAPGKIEICTLGFVRTEYDRVKVHYDKLNASDQLTLVASGEGNSPAGTDEALTAFFKGLGIDTPSLAEDEIPENLHPDYDAQERQQRQFDELVDFTQRLLDRSARVRDEFWSMADRSSVENWVKSTELYRNYVWEEMIGKLPEPTMPPNVRTRKVIDNPAYTAYEVVIDVYPDVIASGILLLPTDLKPDEKRPVVVCQHGLEGVPMDTITRDGPGYNYYKSFAAELAKRGFITYAPQNPYRGKDLFRTLQRKSNPMKRSLFSYIIRQHERTLAFLSSLPNVDPARIGFYGLSYGGKTAVRVPPILTQYALSICSADYNEWIRKNVTNQARYSYMFTGEYEMFEWNMGHVANYAELASLMTPRPFMVERGHADGVAPDEWVAWEYAKVRRHYAQLGMADKTEIEFFNGPHTINGQGTYDFLHRHLNWPRERAASAGASQ